MNMGPEDQMWRRFSSFILIFLNVTLAHTSVNPRVSKKKHNLAVKEHLADLEEFFQNSSSQLYQISRLKVTRRYRWQSIPAFQVTDQQVVLNCKEVVISD